MTKLLWTQKQDIGPSPRSGLAMAYDTSRKRTLLYGGGAARGDCADTWEWDGDYWAQVQDIGPPALVLHSLVFDRARSKGVLFGGLRGSTAVNRNTWEWDGADWTQVQDSGPVGRHSTAMCFDAERGRVVMFGGALPDATMLGDTWEWDGSDWTQVDDVGPSPRHAHAMCFDLVRGRTVLFGGSGKDALADTWEWNGSVWTQVADSGPETAVAATLTFGGGVSSLFGGLSDLGTPAPQFRSDTWDWDGSQWTKRQNMGPSARAFHGATHDSDRGRVVLFGGTDTLAVQDAADHLMDDTWEHTVAIDPNIGPHGLTMSVSPSTVRYGSFISVDFALPIPQATPIQLSVLVGNEVRPAQIPTMATQLSVKIAIDPDVIPQVPPIQVALDVVTQVDGRVLRQTINVLP